MPSRERVEAFLKEVVEGSHVKAIADFYHDDATMQENLGVPRRGKETLMAHEQAALDRMEISANNEWYAGHEANGTLTAALGAVHRLRDGLHDATAG